MRARVIVTLKDGILDPQGKAIQGALKSLGFSGVEEVRQGKILDIELSDRDRHDAYADLVAMCERLLANTVIEDYSVELLG